MDRPPLLIRSGLVCLSCLGLFVLPGLADAQPPFADGFPDNASLARAYAPVLSFAAGELYYPALPFFSAFDGVDNDRDGAIDFQDLDEICPIAPGEARGRFDWNQLNSWYRELDRDAIAAVSAVFYRVRQADRGRLRHILRGDAASYRRLDPHIQRTLDDPDSKFRVIEYYFYYVNDRGITGHPEDIEFVFVFVPEDQSFRVIVGAGHGPATPNNVAVVMPRTDEDAVKARGIRVELGGHASAPDVNANGLFDPGIDATWHTEHLWGVRDIISITGEGATRHYDSWMTFSPDMVLSPPDLAIEGARPYKLLRAEKYFGADGLIPVLPEIDSVPMSPDELSARLHELGLRPSVLNPTVAMAERVRHWTGDGWGRAIDSDGSLDDEFTQPAGKHLVALHRVYRDDPELIFDNNLFARRGWPGFTVAWVGKVHDKKPTWASYEIGLLQALSTVPFPLRLTGELQLRLRWSHVEGESPREYSVIWTGATSRRTGLYLGAMLPKSNRVHLLIGASLRPFEGRYLWFSANRLTWRPELRAGVRMRVGEERLQWSDPEPELRLGVIVRGN